MVIAFVTRLIYYFLLPWLISSLLRLGTHVDPHPSLLPHDKFSVNFIVIATIVADKVKACTGQFGYFNLQSGSATSQLC